MSRPSDSDDSDLRWPQLVMRLGLAGAFTVMVAGIVAHLVTGGPAHAMRFSTLLTSTAVEDRLLMGGALLLAATPAVQIVVLAVGWWRHGDRPFALVAVTVLAVLVASALLGGG